MPDLILSGFSWLKGFDIIGSWADILSLSITVIGFTATLIGVLKSKNAAVRAQEAAQSTRDSIRFLDTIVDFSSAIAILEEIKRVHRDKGAWSTLPDRYASIRKQLISLRGAAVELTDHQQSSIQAAIINLREMEKQVEKCLEASNPIPIARLNARMSGDIDKLVDALLEIKAQQEIAQ